MGITMGVERLALRRVEAARVLGISPRTLWTWTRTRHIPYVRIGRVVRYPYAALKAWLEEQSRTTAGTVGGRDVGG
jgi:excisionase family DNA binding protein